MAKFTLDEIMNQRVMTYECTAYHTSTGSSSTTRHHFTQKHAQKAGVELHHDGIDRIAAVCLCSQMTNKSNRGSIRYVYIVPVDILLKPKNSTI